MFKKFYIFKTLKSHVLPLTNVCFDKSGMRCITGSYDRTCRIWNIEKGCEDTVLKGHENVVFSVGYNFPRCDRIITGSFDKSAKLWSSSIQTCLKTFYGHTAEVVAAEFNPINNDLIATASMDCTARIFHGETGQEIFLLKEHMGEVISARFNREGNLLLTGSFDQTAMVWDMRSKEYVIQYSFKNFINLYLCLETLLHYEVIPPSSATVSGTSIVQ